MQPQWEELAEELMEEQIFLADVDALVSPLLAQRFQITTIPTYVLLRNRKMYTKGSSAGIQELKNWALKDYQQSLDLKVPPEKESLVAVDPMTAVKDVVETGKMNFRNLIAATKSEVRFVVVK